MGSGVMRSLFSDQLGRLHLLSLSLSLSHLERSRPVV